jgi:hypothetical protein
MSQLTGDTLYSGPAGNFKILVSQKSYQGNSLLANTPKSSLGQWNHRDAFARLSVGLKPCPIRRLAGYSPIASFKRLASCPKAAV